MITATVLSSALLAAERWSTGDTVLVVAVFVAGFASGILSALLGIGGAVVTTPAVRALGASPVAAVGSTVPAILPGAIAGTLRYMKAGLVDWRTSLTLGISGSALAVVGALAVSATDARILMIVTAFVMCWSGITVMRSGRKETAAPPASAEAVTLVGAESRVSGVEATETETALVETPPHDTGPRHALPVLVALGAFAGLIAGVLGVGGGVVLVPLMTGPLRIPTKVAVASSLVAVAIFSVPALVAHAMLGHIDWMYALPLMLGVVPGARVGSRITVGASDRTIRTLFGVFVLVIGVVFGVTEASAFF